MIGRRSGRIFRIGDEVSVRLVEADAIGGRLVFRIEPNERAEILGARREVVSIWICAAPLAADWAGAVDCRVPPIYRARCRRARSSRRWGIAGLLRRGSPRFPLPESMPLSLCPAAVFMWASNSALGALLVACVERQSLPSDPTGRLFARGLDEITDLYIAPVSNRKLILAGAARLSRLDDKFSVTDSAGVEGKTQIALSYGGREVAVYPMPADNESHAWGALMGRLVINAKAVSPALAGLSEDQIDKALFDGVTGALDRFSRYAAPEIARDQRAVRDGFGGIGITLEVAGEEFRITQVTSGGPADLAGIRPDDRLVAVDGVATGGRSQIDIVHALRGRFSAR